MRARVTTAVLPTIQRSFAVIAAAAAFGFAAAFFAA
jgi:hypothetical protein